VRPLVANIIRQPAEYLAYPGLDIFRSSTIGVLGDTLVVAFGGVNYLVLYTSAGEPRDTIVVPSRRRRGAMQDLALYESNSFDTYEARMGGLSSVARVWGLPDGMVLVWHRDVAIKKVINDFLFSAVSWVSVIDLGSRRACLDLEIAFPGTSWPRVAYANGVIHALDQVLPDSSADRVVSVVRRYTFAPDHCDWTALPDQ
jgi:hypothetical protein